MKKISLNFLIILMCLNILISCSSTSDGAFVLGVEGSGAWHTFASEKDIKEYWDSHETFELCEEWKDTQFGSKKRAISAALKRRDENPILCSDSDAAAFRNLNKSNKNMEEANKSMARERGTP